MRRQLRATAAAAALAIVSATLVALSAGVASAEPVEGLFTDDIDRYADYDGADSCSATDKPGAVALKTLILAAYPGTTGSISRACGSGSSEHYEGRALDWMVSADTQRPLAEDLFRWLFAEDSYGNKDAMARRLGIMYIIFDRKMWRAYGADEGWQDYSGSNPHTDHVHISMAWDGALQDTTWFTGADAGMRLDQSRFAATWRSPSRYDVFRRGLSGELQIRSWEGAWGDWEDVGGGEIKSGPAAAWAGKTLWVFAQGNDGMLKQRRWKNSSGWEPWEETDVEITAAPGVAAKGKRVDLVVRTPTGSVAHSSWSPKRGWSKWKDLGGVVTAPPAAVWRSPDRLDVFARGTAGRLHQQSLVDGAWSGWSDLGGVLTSGPAVTMSTAGQVDLFTRTARGSIAHRYDNGTGWSAWLELGGRHVSGPTASALADTQLDVYTRVRTGSLNQNYYRPATGWSGWVLR